jgi:T5orf172 domain
LGHVYALQQGTENKIKIGCVRSDRPNADQRRKKTHSTSNPSLLTQIARIDTAYPHICEKVLKDEFQSRKIIDGGGNEWFAITREEVHRAFESARRYMIEYEVEQPEVEKLKEIQSDPNPKEPGNEDYAIYWQIKALDEEMAKKEQEKERLRRKLMLRIGSAGGLNGLVTWKTQFTPTLDQAALRAAHPDLCEQFTRMVQSRPFKLR